MLLVSYAVGQCCDQCAGGYIGQRSIGTTGDGVPRGETRVSFMTTRGVCTTRHMLVCRQFARTMNRIWWRTWCSHLEYASVKLASVAPLPPIHEAHLFVVHSTAYFHADSISKSMDVHIATFFAFNAW